MLGKPRKTAGRIRSLGRLHYRGVGGQCSRAAHSPGNSRGAGRGRFHKGSNKECIKSAGEKDHPRPFKARTTSNALGSMAGVSIHFPLLSPTLPSRLPGPESALFTGLASSSLQLRTGPHFCPLQLLVTTEPREGQPDASGRFQLAGDMFRGTFLKVFSGFCEKHM